MVLPMFNSFKTNYLRVLELRVSFLMPIGPLFDLFETKILRVEISLAGICKLTRLTFYLLSLIHKRACKA